MLYSDLKANIMAILNRRDATPSQINTFCGLAIQRIQRTLRVPAMETSTAVTMDGISNLVPVPGDFLELIDLTFNDNTNQRKLIRTDHQSAIRLSNLPGTPTSFYRDKGNFLLGPKPAQGSICVISYYQDASDLMADTDHNWITDSTPDLLIYGALSYAADFFLDERKQGFEDRYNQIFSDTQLMALQDDLMGAWISPAYSDNPSAYYPYANGSYPFS